jgi:hypothetical protein|tara:strand:+ start:529 stop:735 length:207 start_codon:yes stop_codon:yes gene_type:complete
VARASSGDTGKSFLSLIVERAFKPYFAFAHIHQPGLFFVVFEIVCKNAVKRQLDVDAFQRPLSPCGGT